MDHRAIFQCYTLGASLDQENLKKLFPHPPDSAPSRFKDICHMLKSVRNCLCEGGIFADKNANKIEWRYIVEQIYKKRNGYILATNYIFHGDNKRRK